MQSLSELKNESTLASIAELPLINHTNHLLFAIIIDISEPIKKGDKPSSNYNTKLKVIDPSFNYKQKLENPNLKFHKFVHVNIYTETPEEAPRIKFIGDILRMRRFHFKMTPRGELMANEKQYSNWLVHPGRKGEPLASGNFKKFPKNFNRQLNNYEKTRIEDLRAWADEFFFVNSLNYINWWNNIKISEEELLKQPLPYFEYQIDLILKCTKQERKKNKTTLFLQDKRGNMYTIGFASSSAVKVNEVIKLRCVTVEFRMNKKKGSIGRVIKLGEKSSCVFVPSFFYDYRIFSKTLKKQSKSKQIQNLTEQFPFLGEYSLSGLSGKKTRYVAAVKDKQASRKVSSAKQMLKNLENFAEHQNEKFLLDGYLTGFDSVNHKEYIKKLERSSRRVSDFSAKGRKGEDYQTIFYLKAHFKDKSVKENQDYLSIHVLNDDFTPLFDSWELLPSTKESSETWRKVKESKYRAFDKQLKKLCKAEHRVRFVVQLLVTGTNKPFLKLSDTVFLPF